MAVSLQKGQKVSLTKSNPGLSKVMVGLGWDEAPQKAQGVFGALFGGGKTQDIDCDATAILLQGGKLRAKEDIVYFGNLRHMTGMVQHMGDNLTGAGEGDDEQILIDLAGLPAQYDRIVMVVNIYQAHKRGQHFGMIRNAFIGMTAMIFGEIYRYNGEWKFNAIGQGTNDAGIGDLAQRFV